MTPGRAMRLAAGLCSLLACPAALAAYGPDAVSRKVGTHLLGTGAVVGGLQDHGAPPERARHRVYVRVRTVDDSVLDALADRGLEIVATSPGFGLVDGWAEPSALRPLAELPFVTMIRPVAPPMTQAGAVVTEGDAALGADRVRAAGITGAGVTLAVISDGINSAETARAAGELPSVVVPPDDRCPSTPGDEGTAMLEIVHDVAPGAALLFASFGASGVQMAEAVRCLADAGADVIVDDVTYPDEPFFQDGPLAAAAREVVGRGVSYHTSAGNRRREFVEQQFVGVPIFLEGRQALVQDFGQGGGDPSNDVTIGAGRTATCSLQWDEPFGAAATDLDLFVFLGPSTKVAESTNPQEGAQDPIEVVQITNPTESNLQFSLIVHFFGGDPNRLLRLVCFQSLGLEHVSVEGAIYGQQAVPEVIALASIDVADEGHDTIEAESSPGPARILFPTPEIREKPDLATFDGVATTTPGFERFFGTSAAAPHSAAVAALMLSKNPTLTPAQVQDLMRQTTVDIEAPGFDRLAGAGRLDAVAVVGAVPCEGFSALPEEAACAGQTVPRAVARKYRAARRRVLKADGAPARRAARLLRAARKRAAKGRRAVDRRQSKLAADCATALRSLLARVDGAAACRLGSP